MSDCPNCIVCDVPIDWTFADEMGFMCDVCYQDQLENE